MAKEDMEANFRKCFLLAASKQEKNEFVFFHLKATKQQSGMKP